ncbi:hypothetical protein AMECASPLE_031518 [Ameca splendens]|uniref:Uncharacterized protein n=1 Tax=Ameca splendens TaxID=208324 RepID=A0ABV0ZF30_9TELE
MRTFGFFANRQNTPKEEELPSLSSVSSARTDSLKWRLLPITAPTARVVLSRDMPPMLPSHHRRMVNQHSKAMDSRIMDHTLNLLQLLLIAVTPRQPLQLQDILSSNNNMDRHMASSQQLVILLPSLLLMAIHSQPRVTELVVTIALLLLLLLQLPPSLTALSQGTLPNLPTLGMVNRLHLLRLRVLTPNRLVTTKALTPKRHLMDSNSLDIRVSRLAITSSRDTNSRHHSSNKPLLLTLHRVLVPMAKQQLINTTSKVDHPVITSLALTVTTDRMVKVEVLAIQALSLEGTLGVETTGARVGTDLTEVE